MSNTNNTFPSPNRRSPRIANQSQRRTNSTGTSRLLTYASDESSPTILPSRPRNDVVLAIDRARSAISRGSHGYSAAAATIAARESIERVMPGATTAAAAIANAPGRRRAAADAAAPDASRATKKKKKGPKFHNPEIFNFLHITEDILPISGEEWEDVETEHMIEYAEHNRTAASIRRKFMELYNKKIPTGDPTMPDTVRLAKTIRYKIEEKSDAAVGVEVDDAELGIEPDDAGVTSANQGSACARRPESRPFVSPRNRNNNTTSDLMQMMMASMMERQQRAEEEREERRVQQQQSQMMMAAMMASIVGRAAPTAPTQSQNRDAGVGDDEADESWDLVGGGGAGAGKPKDDRDYD